MTDFENKKKNILGIGPDGSQVLQEDREDDYSRNDNPECANDRIAALRQQFMNFRKQSEVMNIKPLEMHHEHSEANRTTS